MRWLAIIVGLAALAGACATRPGSPTDMAPDAPPAPVPGYDWRFIPDPHGEARLAYGGEESDALVLALDCTTGTRKLTLSAPAERGARPEFHLESGGDTERYAAHAEDAGFADGDWLTAEAASTAPVFQRFRRLGWMAMWRGDDRQMLAGHPDALPGVKRFLEMCEGG